MTAITPSLLLEFEFSDDAGRVWKLVREAGEGVAIARTMEEPAADGGTCTAPAPARLRWMAGDTLTLVRVEPAGASVDEWDFRLDGEPVSTPVFVREGQKLAAGPVTVLWRTLPRNEWPTVPGGGRSAGQAPGAAARLAEELKQGRYRSGNEVGRGGMGRVLEALEKPLRRAIALKVLLEPGNGEDQERFVREARITGGLQHPSIIPVHELNVDESGRIFYTMKLVQGSTLHTILTRLDAGDPNTRRRYPLPSLLTVFQKVCDAVAFAHGQPEPVVHRDLKPENIMVGDYGEVLVMDWGAAKVLQPGGTDTAAATGPGNGHDSWESDGEATGSFVTQAGSVMGTPGYMAPEQARGQAAAADERTDIYALGAILYALLTWKSPVKVTADEAHAYDASRRTDGGEAARAFRRQVTPLLGEDSRERRMTPRPGMGQRRAVPASLVPVVLKAMALDPADRFPDVKALQADVAAYQAGFATSAEQARAWKRFKLLVARNRALSSSLAAVFVILLTATTISLHQRQSAVASNAGLQLALHRASLADHEAARQHFRSGAWREGLALLGRSLTFWPENQAAADSVLSAVLFGRGDADRLPLFGVEHGDAVYEAVFSPDGRWFATASYDHTARVWNAATGAPAAGGPLRHTGPLASARFSPDSRKIVTASEDGVARVWDAQTGRALTPAMEHGDPAVDVTRNVETAVFSPDGRRILTACWDHTARVWDAETGREIARLPHPARVASASFSPDGTRILACYWYGGARLWDAATFQPIGEPMTHARTVRKALFSPDGRRVVTTSLDSTARIWDAATGRPLTAPLPHPNYVWNLAISPDGRLLATACYDQTARLWSMEDGTPVGAPMKHDGPVDTVDFSPDGTRLVTCGRDKTVRLWDVRSQQPTGEPMHHDDGVFGAVFSPDGATVLSAGWDHAAYLWDVRPAPRPGEVLPTESEVRLAEFTDDPDQVFLATRSGRAGRWSLSQRRFVSPVAEGVGETVAGAYCRASGVFAAAGPDGTVRFWNGVSGTKMGEVPGRHGVLSALVFSADVGSLFTASLSGTAGRWKVPEGTPLGSPMPHPEQMDTLALSPDGKEVATGCRDSFIRFWDAATGRQKARTIRMIDPVISLSYAADGRTLAIGSVDHTARIWSLADDRQLGPNLLGKGAAACVRQAAGGQVLLVAGPEDTEVGCYDPRTATPLRFPLPHPAGVEQIAVNADGSQILTVARGGVARLWRMPAASVPPPKWLGDYVRALGGVEFSAEQQFVVVPTRERLRLRAALLAGERDATAWDRVKTWSFERVRTGAADPWSHADE